MDWRLMVQLLGIFEATALFRVIYIHIRVDGLHFYDVKSASIVIKLVLYER